MDYNAARQAMVDCQLATNNVISHTILEAMGRVPREEFVPEIKKDAAYLDEDIYLGEGRYLLEPMIFARMVQALDPKPEEVLLDIGSGCGYSASVLSDLVETVVAVEPNAPLMERAQKIWRKLSLCNIADLQEPIDQAAAGHGPYDMILISGSVSKVPETIAAELKEGSGRMVCVLREDPKATGRAVLVQKMADGSISIVTLFDANVPYMTEYAPKEEFSF